MSLPLGLIFAIGVCVLGILSLSLSLVDWSLQLLSVSQELLLVRSVQSLCLREQMSSQGMGGFRGREELVDYRGPMGRCWSSLSAGGLPTDQLVQLRWVGEGPGVFWAVQVCGGAGTGHSHLGLLCTVAVCVLVSRWGHGWWVGLEAEWDLEIMGSKGLHQFF